jgi:UDP-N-acetylmuramoylalanine--D-glutamate ligase
MSTDFAHKNILVLGAGVTGKSVARFLESRGANITLVDDNAEGATKPADVKLDQFTAVVISPGWRQDHPLVSQILNSTIELLNEIDIAWQLRAEKAPNQKWIAVTGTNGKTTTVEMTAAIVKAAGIKAVACGNVGDTVIDAVDRDDPYEVLVLELSSFQLHWAKEANFVAAAILNIADDHLDWHGSFEAYADAKFSILRSNRCSDTQCR